jgi:hypothetical protein
LPVRLFSQYADADRPQYLPWSERMRTDRMTNAERGARFGAGVGLLTGVGFAVIWGACLVTRKRR